jgi:hypothetical protein
MLCYATTLPIKLDLRLTAPKGSVQSINENKPLLGTASDLSNFLFNLGKACWTCTDAILIEYQGDNCIYCLRPLRGSSDVDHFIS